MKSTGLKLATMTALGAAALMGNQVVHADEVEPATADNQAVGAASTEEASTQAIAASQGAVDVAQKAVAEKQTAADLAQNDLNDANAGVKQGQVDINMAENKVAAAKGEVADSQQAQAAAVAEAKAAVKAVDDTIDTGDVHSAVDAAITTQTDVVSHQAGIVAEAQAAKSTADSAVETAATEAETAAAAVAAQQETIAQAQSAVDRAQTGGSQAAAEAQQANKAAQAAAQEAAQAAEAATQTAKSAEQADKAAQTAVSEAQTKTDQAQIELAAATADAAQTAQAAESSAQAVSDLTAQVEAAENAINDTTNHSTITVPAGMTRANYDKYVNDQLTRDEYKKQFDQWDHVADKSALSHFVDNEADQAQVLDGVTMTQEQKEDLTRFAVAVLNDVRDQYGTPIHVQATEEMIRFADDIVKEYEAADWELVEKGDHFDAGIGRAAIKHGLDGAGNYYENLSAGYLNYETLAGLIAIGISEEDARMMIAQRSPLTMNDLKRGVYDTMVGMLFADSYSNYGHAMSLVGDNSQNENGEYFAVSVDDMGQIHLISVKNDDIYVQDRAKFDTTPLPDVDTGSNQDPAKLAALQAALTAAKAKVSTDQAASTRAQKSLASIKQDAEVAEGELVTAQKALATAEADVAAAKTAVTAAAEALATSKQQAAAAQAAVDQLTATNTATQQAALAQAKAALAAETGKLPALEAVNITKAAALADAQKTADTAAGQVTATQRAAAVEQAKLERLTAAKDKLATAATEVPQAEAALTAAENSLAAAKQKLTGLWASQIASQATFDAANDELQAAQARLTDKRAALNDLIAKRDLRVQIAAEQARLAEAAKQATTVKRAKAVKLTGALATALGPARVSSSTSMETMSAAGDASKGEAVATGDGLPQTGEDAGRLGTILGAFLLFLNIGLFTKRRKETD